MNDDLHPLSRREGPSEADEPSEPERPLVLHRRWGHRGRCWVLRSLDADTIAMVLALLLGPFRWLEPAFWVVVWPFRRVLRFFAWIGRLLSALGDL
ncbi:hypothetical protein ACIBIZ_20435 [Nonomuraea spiralis]|uniref:hypothetical protein n=1 Tax=Nonomuraea TaxID=83681 RepID=UPI000F79C26A|nr:hypothetical protein [Nonomuraea sp. WAC 01424]RSM97138.1 hypothetical protein DMB42_47115 [Nonomuraea sp. WAC 01424]